MKQRMFCLKAEYVVSHVGTAKRKERREHRIGLNQSGDNTVNMYSSTSFTFSLISICTHGVSTSPLCPSKPVLMQLVALHPESGTGFIEAEI